MLFHFLKGGGLYRFALAFDCVLGSVGSSYSIARPEAFFPFLRDSACLAVAC